MFDIFEKLINKKLFPKVAIYKTLKILHHETNLVTFEQMWANFKLAIGKGHPEFAVYFNQHYAGKEPQWTYCYRVTVRITCNKTTTLIPFMGSSRWSNVKGK